MSAIQDSIPDNNCFGCGPDNPLGMQIKSRWKGDVCVCRYTPKPEQCAGPPQYVYGGTIASLIDCHSVCTALSHYYTLKGRAVGEPPDIWCVTGRLTVNYLAPTPIDRDIELRASVGESDAKKCLVNCDVFSGDTLVAKGEVVAVRVADSWKSGEVS